MDNLAVTVAISALVSGVVALGIEWAAKPRLEARKERILERQRKRRALKKNLVTIMVITSRWKEWDPAPGVMSEAEIDRLVGELRRQWQQVDDMTRAMSDEIGAYADAFTGHRIYGTISPREAVARYIPAARGVMLSDGRPSQQIATLYTLTRPVESVISHRFDRMPGALPALREILDKYAELGAKVSPPVPR